MIDVSFIIVNYNTTALTIKCIEAITFYTLRNTYEIILIDNASEDRSIAEINSMFPGIKLILSKENLGFGRANNLGIAMAKGKYVFLINTDAFLLSDAVSVFWDFMEDPGNKNVACCGADLLDEHQKPGVAYGNFPSFFEAVSSLGFNVFYRKYFERHISAGVVNYADMTREVDFLCGADMFIRKTVLDELGTFDPAFFLYYEETELSLRMNRAGYRSMIIPSVKIMHIAGGSQKVKEKVNLKNIEFFTTSRNLYFKKCHGDLTAFGVKVVYALKACLHAMISRDTTYFTVAKLIWRS